VCSEVAPILEYIEAIECCRKYAADRASSGYVDFTYYAVEIKHRVGIEHGKIVDEPLK
jgi:hypothetical protein